MTAVLVLNAGYERLHYVSLRHAVGMLVRQVAVVEEEAPGHRFGPWPRPAVVRLVRYVQMTWRARGRPSWSRRAVLRRDTFACAYCGDRATTVDHVVPRSRGGADSWLNTVAACHWCNHRKRDRTPEEAGMPLRFAPRVPSWGELMG
jgi:5-methylcytosine-specific restriction endonuclease McrA